MAYRRGFYRYSAVANNESDDAVERLLPSQHVEFAEENEFGQSASGAVEVNGNGQPESGTAVSLRPTPRRSWFDRKNVTKVATSTKVAAKGTSGGSDHPDETSIHAVAAGEFREGVRDRLLDSDDV